MRQGPNRVARYLITSIVGKLKASVENRLWIPTLSTSTAPSSPNLKTGNEVLRSRLQTEQNKRISERTNERMNERDKEKRGEKNRHEKQDRKKRRKERRKRKKKQNHKCRTSTVGARRDVTLSRTELSASSSISLRLECSVVKSEKEASYQNKGAVFPSPSALARNFLEQKV